MVEEYGWGRKPTQSSYRFKTGMSNACKGISGGRHEDCCSLSCTCDCHIVSAERKTKLNE